MRVERRVEVEPAVADPRRHADALAENGNRSTQPITRQSNGCPGRVHRIADAEHAADVQHLQHVAGLDAWGNVPE